MDDMTSKMGFIFCNLVNYCSSDLTETDLEGIIPILLFLEENNNFEASLLLANYHDPGGCLFKNNIENTPTNHAIAKIHYAKAAQMTQSKESDREKNVFEYCRETLKMYEFADGDKFDLD